ncbi:uncharacterized protein LOC100833441 [Brachypodium distachyon]|uniref:BLE2 protein n=1 Tax=Brachypodium distachyon TaxID=15368 RepID=A0A0Q3GV75_BRADI|nr:uncharacterized protein LOC100833441 [Brachypodium distachyon]KQK14904.1 hypothetical protein BRADI_1g19400v3 [Brachypodium distachyon]|eukprot:XP_003559874.3 uncharacterized protein LOC100833441 [Brachypodium distachyon]
MEDVAEHRVHMPAADAGKPPNSKSPEKWLNGFVRAVALMEKVGNALGTLAFTWATVVLLGGYTKDLEDDFWFATAIVFLEAARMFTRKNRMEYRLVFNNRGAFRPFGSNGLIMMVCFLNLSVILLREVEPTILVISGVLAMTTLVIGWFLSRSGLKLPICHPLRRATSLWSPVVGILLLVPSLSYHSRGYLYGHDQRQYIFAKFLVFTSLLAAVLLVSISRLRFPSIVKLVDRSLGSRQVFWRRVILYFCMVGALITHLCMLGPHGRVLIIIILACALAVVSFGNFQVPAAVLRVVLALLHFELFKSNTMYDDNLKASLAIFYGVVLGQGTLYSVACTVEFFSFIPRRSLVHCGGFRGQYGVESVNLYYAYAFEKCMQDGVFAPTKTSLGTFAMDSVNSDSSKNQLYGLQMMHNFLQKEPTKAPLLYKLTTSPKTMARIIRMLDWTSPKDAIIRLYAAKVTSEFAKNLRVVAFPGTMQIVSALLAADSRPKIGNPLLDTDDEQEDSQDEEHDPSKDAADNQLQRQDQLPDTDNLLQTQTCPTQQVSINPQNSMLRCWQRISEFWSIPKEMPLTNNDLLPALAMSIIDSLAGCDQDNCAEISKAADLIQKIVEFTGNRSDEMITEAQQKILLLSSLKVMQRLTSIGGKIGITLRYEIAKDPFLQRNLKEILGDSMTSPEFKRLVAAILRNLAVDGDTRQEISRIQLIITMLMQTFINTEGTMSNNAGRLLRKVAGQALAMLTIESVHTCLIMLKEPEFIKELKTMILIHDDKYMYVAASLLRNLCLHAQSELRELDLKEISHTLREVLERIMDTERAELEILVGLSSQICKVIPGDFTRELDDGHTKQRFVKRLVVALIANKKPRAHCPGIRRLILEQVIFMTECNSNYADCFNECRMKEALLMVEQTLSKVENYRLFLGNTGFMEYSMPISALVARAKELLGCD